MVIVDHDDGIRTTRIGWRFRFGYAQCFAGSGEGGVLTFVFFVAVSLPSLVSS